MTENRDFYTDRKRALEVPAAPQEEIAAAEEPTPVGAPEKKKRPRWAKLLCLMLCAVLLVSGGKILWETYPLWDTNPNAPFMDLSCWTKEKVKKAVTEYWQKYYGRDDWPTYWHGEKTQTLGIRYMA